MRPATLFVMLLSYAANSQTNRSASELARENVEEYLLEKIFKNKSYHPTSYGSLERFKVYDPNIHWIIEHKFEISQTIRSFGKDTVTVLPYKFVFYLDRKLRVFRADSFQGNLLLNDTHPAATVRRE